MKNVSRIFKGPLIWILLCIGLIIVFLQFTGSGNGYKDIPTSEAVSIINSDKKLDGVTLTDGDQVIKITENDDKKYRSYWVGNQSDQLVDKLNDRVQDKTLKSWQGENPGQSIWKALLINFLPFVIILLFFLWAMNAAQGMGGRGGVMGFGKSKAKVGSKDTPKSTFADVAGCQEAIDELQEIREFLAEPAKFQRVGAKIPKGVLLYGPPGTGKTLVRTSSRCSSASAPPGSATSSSRPRRPLRRSSSSMRLTLSAGTVVLVWAAGTTNVSRR